jgi:phage-related protein
VRVFYFALSGRRILLLHAFLKKSQQTPRRELEIAARRLAEVVESKQ